MSNENIPTPNPYVGPRTFIYEDRNRCNDDSGNGNQSNVSFRVESGETYYFQVGGFEGQTGSLVFRVGEQTGHSGDVQTVAFSPDGDILASGSIDGTVILWDVKSGDKISNIMRVANGPAFGVAFSPDGSLLVAVGGNLEEGTGTVRVWDITFIKKTGNADEKLALDVQDLLFTDVAFSPDGSLLAASGGDFDEGIPGTVRVWDVASLMDTGNAEEILALEVQDLILGGVAFSPDGSLLAVSGGDDVGETGAVRLWDITSIKDTGNAKEILMLKGHEGEFIFRGAVAFSPDGNLIASSGDDNAFLLSPIPR